MATGALSSAHQQKTTQAAAVLRSGEKQASTPEALKNPNAKVFYHHVPGAKFIMPDGLELVFMAGRLVTDDPVIIAELNKIANKSTSLISTDKAVQAAVTAAQDAAAADAAVNASA